MVKINEDKASLYLLAIVGVVAAVGIVVLILNSGAGSVSLSSDDLTGQATMLDQNVEREKKIQERIKGWKKEVENEKDDDDGTKEDEGEDDDDDKDTDDDSGFKGDDCKKGEVC